MQMLKMTPALDLTMLEEGLIPMQGVWSSWMQPSCGGGTAGLELWRLLKGEVLCGLRCGQPVFGCLGLFKSALMRQPFDEVEHW